MSALDLSTARWRKSTRSSDTNTCVEVAFAGQVVGLRDSKNADGPLLAISAASFAALTASVR
jgi:Domain of unknown function (DUF397)